MIAHFKAAEHRFLSNMWPCKVMFEGEEYGSVEHAYMAAKSLDPEIRRQVRDIRDPRKAKAFGKSIVLRPDWDAVKLGIMRQLIAEKFSHQNPECRELLRRTGDEHIQEGNWWCDFYWGVSIRNDRTKGRGENHLGRLIMEQRAANNGGDASSGADIAQG